MGKEEPETVKAKRHTPNQVIRKLREAERMLGEGKSTAEVATTRFAASWQRIEEANRSVNPELSEGVDR